jgi:hypothetical protein
MLWRTAIWLLPLAFICTACPYESRVPLSRKPVEAVDPGLVGYWYGIVKDGSDYFGIEALEIEPLTDSVYSITRYGKAIKGDMILPDTARYSGFISYIGDQRFMNVQGIVQIPARKGGFEERKVYYLSLMDVSNDTLTVRTVTEDFTTRKDFASPEELKMMIENLSRRDENIFDDLYSLSYRKMEKPGR